MGPTQKIALPCGELAFREFGAREGFPLLFFHGWPASSYQAWMIQEAAARHGFHGFALDRPGIGASPCRPRSLAEWPGEVCEFAERQGLHRFCVFGVSGGGPYALACAALCPDRLQAAAIVCGAPPIFELANHTRLNSTYAFLLRVYRTNPRLVHAIFRLMRPVFLWRHAREFFPPLRITLPRPDAEAITPPEQFAWIFDPQSDAFGDVDGVFADAEIYARPWGFAPEDIRVPVQFWHGREDFHFHYTLTEELAARIPKATVRVMEGEGHFSLPINHADGILAELAKWC